MHPAHRHSNDPSRFSSTTFIACSPSILHSCRSLRQYCILSLGYVARAPRNGSVFANSTPRVVGLSASSLSSRSAHLISIFDESCQRALRSAEGKAFLKWTPLPAAKHSHRCTWSGYISTPASSSSSIGAPFSITTGLLYASPHRHATTGRMRQEGTQIGRHGIDGDCIPIRGFDTCAGRSTSIC